MILRLQKKLNKLTQSWAASWQQSQTQASEKQSSAPCEIRHLALGEYAEATKVHVRKSFFFSFPELGNKKKGYVVIFAKRYQLHLSFLAKMKILFYRYT